MRGEIKIGPVQIIRMVEYGACPRCGDKLRPGKKCQNRSGKCGLDWTGQYNQAKKQETKS